MCLYLSKASLHLLIGAEHLHLSTPHGDDGLWAFSVSSSAPQPQGRGCLWLWVLLVAYSSPQIWAAQYAFTFSPRSSSSCSKERYAEPARLHTGTVEAGGGFFPLLRRKLREKQAAKLCRKWSLLSAGTHNYSCGRTEAVHLPEMRERTAVMLVVSSGCEQRKRTFYLLQFPARLFPYSTTCYIKTLEQDAPNHSRKPRIGVIFILEGHRDFSLSILQRSLLLLGHPGHPSYNTMCNCRLQKQPHALVRQRLMEEREEKERRYLFLLSPGLWDSGHNCLWDESPIPIPPHNTAATTPPLGFAGC